MNPPAALRMRFDVFELDELDVRLTREGVPVLLSPKAFAVLCALAREPGRLLTKNAVLDEVWGHRHVSESVLKTAITHVRAALGDDAKQPRFIETVSRRGYRFIATGTPQPVAFALAPLSAPPPAEDTTFVGRVSALERLREAWDSAQQGKRRLLWIAGDAGVGKTTLIDHLIAQLGPHVLSARGQCVEPFGAGEPYLPVLEALGTLCRRDPTLPPLMRTIAPSWLRQMPWLSTERQRAELQDELAGAGQDRMLREMGELLDRYTERGPLLIITEDLHWSDHATLRLIDHVARRRTPGRLLWLGSFRLAEVVADDHPLQGLRRELKLHRLCDELILGSFSERELAEYLERRLPAHGMSEDFIRALHAHTDGLPLFVINLIDDLLARGTSPASGPTVLMPDQLQGPVPESLADIIEKQLERLAVEDRLLLTAASVSGMEFRPETVADALQWRADETRERIDRLASRQRWLQPLEIRRKPDGALDTPYVFQHALYRQVLYQRCAAAARIEMHRRIGQSLERARDRGTTVASSELSMHFERGKDLPCALRHFTDAAASAMQRFAPLEATRHTAHALSLLDELPPGTGRLERELALVTVRGTACAQLVGLASPDAIIAFERARALCELLPSTPERAWVQNGLGWVYYTRGEFAKALALAERIHAQALASGDRVLLLAACSQMGFVLCRVGSQEDSRRWIEQGFVLCRELGTHRFSASFVVDPEVSLHANICVPLMYMGLENEALEHAERARNAAETLGQPMARMLSLWAACMVHSQLGQHERVLACAREMQQVVEAHDIAQGEGPSRWYRGWALAHLGEHEAGYALILEGYARHARFDMFCGCPRVLGLAAEALMQAGRWEDARRHLEDAVALARRMGEILDLPLLLILHAAVSTHAGRSDEARSALLDAVATARQSGAHAFEHRAQELLASL